MTTGTTQTESVRTPEQIGSQAKEFARKNRVRLLLKVGKCVDGRYPYGKEAGWARPGGDIGYSMGLLGAGFSPEEAFQMVYDWCEKEGRPFFWHTDDHSQPLPEKNLTSTGIKMAERQELTAGHAEHSADKPVLGCGHCARAMSRGELYGLDGEKVKAFYAVLLDAQFNKGLNVVCETLTGSHGETDVMVVHGTEETVLTQGEDGTQYFIYNADVDAMNIESLLAALKAQGVEVNTQAFNEALGKQTGATLALLAGNKSIVEVWLNADDVEVKVGDTIQPAPVA